MSEPKPGPGAASMAVLAVALEVTVVAGGEAEEAKAKESLPWLLYNSKNYALLIPGMVNPVTVIILFFYF